nr:hypothetical protein [Tanacetum cinerariifolium]
QEHLLIQPTIPNSSVKPPFDDVNSRHHRREHLHDRVRDREPGRDEETKAKDKRMIENQAVRDHERSWSHYNIKPLPQRQFLAFPDDLSLGIVSPATCRRGMFTGERS